MTDSEKQAAFLAGLRKAPEEAAAKNPTLADMGKLAKALVAAARTKIAESQTYSPLGAYLDSDGEVSIVRPESEDSNVASTDILLKLATLAREGNLRAAAICHVLDKQILASIATFIQVHIEHVVGKVLVTAVPADKSVLLAGAPGVEDPAGGWFGSRTQSKIFSPRN
jgi:hypothetical protein